MKRIKIIKLDDGSTIYFDLSKINTIEKLKKYTIVKYNNSLTTLVDNNQSDKLIADWLTYKELENNRDYRKDEYFTLGAEVFKEYIRRHRDE